MSISSMRTQAHSLPMSTTLDAWDIIIVLHTSNYINNKCDILQSMALWLPPTVVH